MSGHALKRESTNHPFIVKNKDICGGSPTMPTELKWRFEQFVSGLLKGKDAGRTRIVLE